MQKHRHLGIRINCEACCDRLKIKPGRAATRGLGCDAQLTGVRSADDENRDRVLHEHGACYTTAGLTIYHPIAHWTDVMVRRYLRQNGIPRDPSCEPGQINGCQMCAGGWRFELNKLQYLRKQQPVQWWEFIVEQGAWLPLLVVKYRQPARVVEAAVACLGGIEVLVERYPHVFDFGQVPPMRDYVKD